MKQIRQTYSKNFRISLLLVFIALLAVQIATRHAEAAPPTGEVQTITEEQAIAIVTGQEVGENDFRISFMGGDKLYDAGETAVAYNPTNNEYLVVWEGDDNREPLVDEEIEIFGQRVDATTGLEVGLNDFRISSMGTNGDAELSAFNPAIAYDSTLNQYLVVWEGDDDTIPMADEDFEIFGQLLAADGSEIGADDFRISDMGLQDGDTNFPAFTPAVAYNPVAQEYLVVWEGLELLSTAIGATPETEIFGQRINANNGQPVGTNDFRISDMGPNGNDDFEAFSPAIAYNSEDNQYLVVWYGDDDSGSLVNGELEIFGQLLNADGSETGDNDFRISNMGPDQNTAFGALNPAITYNPTHNQYLVVWTGDDDGGQLINNEFEIFGQLLTATGGETGLDDFRISSMGPDGDLTHIAFSPTVSFSQSDGRYLVSWWGNDNAGGLAEYEIFGQVLTADGSETDPDDFRLSDMGPNDDVNYAAVRPAVACQATMAQCLVAWHGDDDLPSLIDNENEIFGQLVRTNGTEIGPNDTRLSDMGNDKEFLALTPDVAYNSTENEYLVVWSGDDNGGTLVKGEDEIFGQRINAQTGQAIGNHFRISDMGPDSDEGYDANSPKVVYNAVQNEYLVVWSGDNNVLANSEFEIFGQLLNAAGAEIGPNDFRISDMGPDNDESFDAFRPAVVHITAPDLYLVVWFGEDNVDGLVDGEFEIFGQFLQNDGTEISTNDFRISNMGPDGDTNFDAYNPAAVYNMTENEILVVWHGDDTEGTLADEEFEIFGQRINTITGEKVGDDDFRISHMGPDGDPNYGAFAPDLAYNPTLNQYLVVWTGVDDINGLIEIFGQLLNGVGEEIGNNDFHITNREQGNVSFADQAQVIYNATAERYLVVWTDNGTDDPLKLDREIYGQQLHPDGTQSGADDIRLSDMGPDNDQDYFANLPRPAFNSKDNEYFVTWQGVDNTPPLEGGEYEIFGQRFVMEREYSIYLPLVVKP